VRLLTLARYRNEESHTYRGTVSGTYRRFAKYYDLVYRDIIDYDEDCDRLEILFRRFRKADVASVLDLGCGTGTHDLILARRGYEVTGLDASAAQMREARAKLRGKRVGVRFVRGDMRGFDLRRTFDASVCLFGGFGYLLTDRDVRGHLRCVRRHLESDGLYVFEFWQESAVIPNHRSWYHREKPFRLIRLDRSTHDARRHRLNVEFEFLVFDGDRVRERFTESHVLRVYGIAEMRRLLAASGLRLLAAYAGRQSGHRFERLRKDSFAVLAVAAPAQ